MAKTKRTTTQKPTDAELEAIYTAARTVGPAITPDQVKAAQARCEREQGADHFSEMLSAGVLARDTEPWFDSVRDDQDAAEATALVVAHIQMWEARLRDRLEIARIARLRAEVALTIRGDMRAMLEEAQRQLHEEPSADVLA